MVELNGYSNPMKQFSLISDIAAPFQRLTQIHCIIFPAGIERSSAPSMLNLLKYLVIYLRYSPLTAWRNWKCNLISRFNATTSVGKSICHIKADFVACNQVSSSSRTFFMDCHFGLSGLEWSNYTTFKMVLINWLAFYWDMLIDLWVLRVSFGIWDHFLGFSSH